jgi:hypothetical protein
MSAAREAIYLPFLFLTVTLLGGVRLGGGLTPLIMVPPSLFSLVLAVLLIGVLIKSGALLPEQLMNAAHRLVANLNGALVLVALLVSSAQAFNLVTPEFGLPRLMVDMFLLALLLNTVAASPSRGHVLRSLAVVFGSAFTLKFIVLAALSDPAGSQLKRLLVVVFEGVTLGALTQDVLHPAAGYLAFLTLSLFLIGLALLPSWKETRAVMLSPQFDR